MQIAALRVVMTDRDSATESNIRRDILHAFRVQSGLELRRHKPIAITRVHQTQEMNSEHGHVEGHRDHDQAEETSKEVLEPDALGCISVGVSRAVSNILTGVTFT
jgi:hypothetical protein